MTMKYHVASCAMVSKMLLILSLVTFDLILTAVKMIAENARKSGMCDTGRAS